MKKLELNQMENIKGAYTPSPCQGIAAGMWCSACFFPPMGIVAAVATVVAWGTGC